MRRRIFSVVLALCLCISSQTVAFAGQEADARQEGLLEEPGSEEEGGEEEDPASQDSSEPPEESEQEENTEKLDQDAALQDSPARSEEADASEPENDDVDTGFREISLQREDVPANRSVEKPSLPAEVDFSPAAVYGNMTALKNKAGYTDEAEWTDYVPYSGKGDDVYRWHGGTLDGKNIVAVGCVAFAFSLSDAAFGGETARMYAAGSFQYEDIKVGDILRMNTDTHTVIVLEVHDNGVVVAEGNNQGKVCWGRTISREIVMRDASHYITRYPENSDSSDDSEADEQLAAGTLGGLTWKLTKAGTLTISGTGGMPDYGSVDEQPWKDYRNEIRKVVIGDGVTSIGACAFWNCGVLGAEIPSSVQTIGNSAFRGSRILSVKIPPSVKTIGNDAFTSCTNLSSVTVAEGVETVGERAFQSCASLESISLPASIEKVGSGAFYYCTTMKTATFASGSKQVEMGDNIFSGCHYLMGVTLPKNIERIGKEMFMRCLMLVGVEIPQGTKSIGENAFSSCSAFTTVVIPDSVVSIGSGAFAACPLEDIYFTGTEARWNSISNTGDTGSADAVSKAEIHYNYTPGSTGPDGGDDDHNKDDNTGDNSGNNHGVDKPGNNSKEDNSAENSSEESSSNGNEAVETWKPTTPDEVRRYACVGREPVRCILPEKNACKVDMENAMQGPMCFRSFEAVLGDYTIGRTYNIYAGSRTTYSTDQKIQVTIGIPSAIYEKGREYKMICVTKGGLPILLDDLDDNPETVTIETDKFHAFALIYK